MKKLFSTVIAPSSITSLDASALTAVEGGAATPEEKEKLKATLDTLWRHLNPGKEPKPSDGRDDGRGVQSPQPEKQ